VIDSSLVYVAATLIGVGVSYGRLSSQIRALTAIQNKHSKVIIDMRDQLLLHLTKDGGSNLRENPATQLPVNGDP